MLSEILILGVVIIIAIIVFALIRSHRQQPTTSTDIATLLQTHQQLMHDQLLKQERVLRDALLKQDQSTVGHLGQLKERMAVIDHAQKNITQLSTEVTGLRNVLDNKQARGAFGELRLETLIQDALPPDAYKFQATLSNGRRADCLLHLPNPPGPTVIDSKFPLESYRLVVAATTEEEKKRHSKAFAGHVASHIEAIATRYIIPGETSENALMFIPAESVYAQIHCDHQDLVKKAYHRRVYLVSPSTLWATLNTITAIFRDVKMREQADIIQNEVLAMLADVQRLDSRIASLQKNYDAMAEDFRRIRISTDKIIRRASSIDALELADDTDQHVE